MKKKHLYLLCFAVTVLIASISMFFMVRVFLESPRVMGQRPLIHPMQVSEESLSDISAQINLLQPRLALLARPKSNRHLPVRLELLGYHEDKESAYRQNVPGLSLSRTSIHSVSFAFVDDGKRFCVVDGSFYLEGAFLPGGGRILKVRPQKVLIEERKIKRWFPVSAGENRSKKEHMVPGEPK